MRSTLQLIGLAVISTAVIAVYQHNSVITEQLIATPIETSPQQVTRLMLPIKPGRFPSKRLTVRAEPRKVASRAIATEKPKVKPLGSYSAGL